MNCRGFLLTAQHSGVASAGMISGMGINENIFSGVMFKILRSETVSVSYILLLAGRLQSVIAKIYRCELHAYFDCAQSAIILRGIYFATGFNL